MNIKTIALATLTTLAPLGAHAMPAGTDALVRTLVLSGKVSEALADQKLPIKAVNISRITDRDAVVRLESICGTAAASKSASALQVELIYDKKGGNEPTVYSVSKYYVTSEDPSELELCKGG